jgi:ankyrin repeat protein
MSAGDWKDMFLAACAGDVELVRHHVDNGVDVDFAHPEFQSTALVASILAGREEVAHLLLDHGADPVLRSELEDLTPVQAAHQAGLAGLQARLRTMGAADPVPAPGGVATPP